MTTETFAKPTELEAEFTAITTCRCALDGLNGFQRERVLDWLRTWGYQLRRAEEANSGVVSF